MSGTGLVLGLGTNAHRYGSALSSVYQRVWVPDPDFAIEKDPKIWDKVLRDPVIAHAVSQRLQMISGRELRAVPGGDTEPDKQAALICGEMKDEIEDLASSRRMLGKSVFHGRGFLFMEGERRMRSFAGGPKREWWVPTRLREVDKERFRIVPVHDSGGMLTGTRVEMWSINKRFWAPLPVEVQRQFVRVVYNNEERRLGYGRGLLESIYYYHYSKGVLLREMLKLAEKLGGGMAVVEMDLDREADSDRPNSAIASEYATEIERMTARNVMVMPDVDKARWEFPQNGAISGFVDQLEYLDKGITQLVTGAVLPTGGGGDTGSFARAETEADTSEALAQFDRRLLDEALSRDLIGFFYDVNRENFAALGLGEARRPKLTSFQEKLVDPSENIELIAKALERGIPLKQSEVYERINMTPPDKDDEVFDGSEAPMPPGGGFSLLDDPARDEDSDDLAEAA